MRPSRVLVAVRDDHLRVHDLFALGLADRLARG